MRKLGGVELRENVVGMHSMREESISISFLKKNVSSYGVNAGSSTYKYKTQTHCVLESKHIF